MFQERAFAEVGVPHPRDARGDAVLLGQQAGDDVHLVDVGDGDEDVRLPHSRLLQDARGGTAPLDGHDVELILYPRSHGGILLDHHYIMCLAAQPLGDVVADLARSDHDRPHVRSPKRCRLASCLPGGERVPWRRAPESLMDS